MSFDQSHGPPRWTRITHLATCQAYRRSHVTEGVAVALTRARHGRRVARRAVEVFGDISHPARIVDQLDDAAGGSVGDVGHDVGERVVVRVVAALPVDLVEDRGRFDGE